MIMLDTTVLVYAVGSDHSLAQPARDLIGAVRDGALRAHTTPEVIQEFAHVRARRTSRADAAQIAEAYATAFAPLQVVTTSHLSLGLELWRNAPDLGAFDAVLAATAITMDAQLISADRAFGNVKGLRWIDLAEWSPSGG
jgi:predicted nucleic acid-binding protein